MSDLADNGNLLF